LKNENRLFLVVVFLGTTPQTKREWKTHHKGKEKEKKKQKEMNDNKTNRFFVYGE